ncbi:MAG: two-component system, OmpR family, response regulator CpxR [Gemmatimonadales bacterium]|jgi:two-component system chemotaxis response regulator CheY|nr:two-component system, OmpR family, response regulator CpxR [Gemmatimonadales bacterium]
MPKRRILVADDDPSIRRTLQIGLGKAGYEVIEARDGEEAARLWRENGVDLIIADIYMPNKSGLQLIMELRAHNSTIPVIAMSDGGRNKNLNPLIYSEVLGSVRTIAKPFSLEDMAAMVKEELAKNPE